jgi:phenylacetate-CoA ligase
VRCEPSERALRGLAAFFDTPLAVRLGRHEREDPIEAALRLFHEVAGSVPAYRAFLSEHGITPDLIKTAEDFARLPLSTKPDYIARYPLAQRCRGGRITSCDIIAVSSGSTGQPSFWPRFQTDELEIATRFEQVFHDGFESDTRTTLAVVCFALGTWVGGLYTVSCCRHLAAKGYPLTVVAPGNNKDEILRVVEGLGADFEQVVLLGYPPFLKDVIDTGRARGLSWAGYRVKICTAGEVFSEEWRALVLERLGSGDPCRDAVSLYGTADAGVLGNETPLSITIRRYLADHPALARELFGEARLPTLVQYDPMSRYFEAKDGTLLFTGDNGVPLIRYHIADEGGLIEYPEMLRFLARHGFDPREGLGRGLWPLPFAYVFGRSQFVLSYFGANVYPENVTVGLEQSGIRDWVTGKFVMQIREDRDRNRSLWVVVELAPGEVASEDRRDAAAAAILGALSRLNSEYANYVPPGYRSPRVELRPTADPEWFPIGVKHRYTRP